MIAYILHHLYVTLSLVSGRRESIDHYDMTLSGFWRSFIALPIAACLQLIWEFIRSSLSSHNQLSAQLSNIDINPYIAFLLSPLQWIIFLLIMIPILSWLQKRTQFSNFVIVGNWFFLLWSFVDILVTILIYLNGSLVQNDQILSYLYEIIMISYVIISLTFHFRYIHYSLAGSWGTTITVMFINALLNAIIWYTLLGHKILQKIPAAT